MTWHASKRYRSAERVPHIMLASLLGAATPMVSALAGAGAGQQQQRSALRCPSPAGGLAPCAGALMPSGSSSSSSFMRGAGVPGRGPRRCGRSRGGVTSTRALFGALEKMLKGEPGERTRQQYQNQVAAVNSFAPAVASLSDEELRGKTAEFKSRLAGGATLEQLLPEAFAVRGDALCVLRHALWQPRRVRQGCREG